MELKPVRSYSGARYPTLAEYLAAKRRDGRIVRLTLAAAFALLAALSSGCQSIS